MFRSVLSFAAAALLAVIAAADDSQDSTLSCGTPTIFTRYPAAGAIGSQWNAATETLAYGRPRPDGHYGAYLNDAGGTQERRVAFASWPDGSLFVWTERIGAPKISWNLLAG